ncbi:MULTISPECIES: hypothetical protein [unclassified Sinorhizobium]|uniref:hypothetical protein n=1 Tax=unclassified Sinorhizobium TaxID=2613772 RepID=UPI00352595DB
MGASRSAISIRGAYLLEDIKLSKDGRRWAQRLTLPLGNNLISLDVWADWDSDRPSIHLEVSEEEAKRGHAATALSLLRERAENVAEGGFTRRQAAKATREFLEVLATGEVPPKMRKAVAERLAQNAGMFGAMSRDQDMGKVVDVRRQMTVSFEEEREAWLKFVPELTRMLGSMPKRKGAIEVYLGAVPGCSGAVLLTVTLVDKSKDGEPWWWCDSECLYFPKGDLGQRISQARSWIAGLKRSRASVARARPVSPYGRNVLSFGWYKKVFEEQNV